MSITSQHPSNNASRRALGEIGDIRFGLLALRTDLNSETELHRILPNNIHLFTSRITNSNPVTMENLSAMSAHLEHAAEQLVPNIDLHTLMYSCTSGTLAIGEEKIRTLVQNSHPEAAITNPISAVVAAFKAMQIKRIHFLTPYTQEVHDTFLAYFQKFNIEIVNHNHLGLDTDTDITHTTADELRQVALSLQSDDADALFISCTALRILQNIAALEAELSLPVITSNQAMLWHALQLSRLSVSTTIVDTALTKLSQYGRLFQYKI